jgi:hypothetical protein
MTGPDPLLAASPAEVEQGICREFLKRGFTADDPVLINPDLISAVMTVVGPVLEAKDAEITRQCEAITGDAEGESDATAEPGRYRKKPVVIKAVQWTGANLREVQELTGTGHFYAVDPEDRGEDPDQTAAVLDKLHSTWVRVYDGDWIIKGIRNEFYPCRPDVFAETHEPAAPGEAGQP